MTYCIHCGKELSFNDIGAHKKFINRGSREFMCISCLAAELNVPEKRIYEKIELFKNRQCRFRLTHHFRAGGLKFE